MFPCRRLPGSAQWGAPAPLSQRGRVQACSDHAGGAQVEAQEARLAEARQAAAAAAAGAADQAARQEHQAAMAAAQLAGLQAALEERGGELQQQRSRAEVGRQGARMCLRPSKVPRKAAKGLESGVTQGHGRIV